MKTAGSGAGRVMVAGAVDNGTPVVVEEDFVGNDAKGAAVDFVASARVVRREEIASHRSANARDSGVTTGAARAETGAVAETVEDSGDATIATADRDLTHLQRCLG